jgi:hypothetical protein
MASGMTPREVPPGQMLDVVHLIAQCSWCSAQHGLDIYHPASVLDENGRTMEDEMMRINDILGPPVSS